MRLHVCERVQWGNVEVEWYACDKSRKVLIEYHALLISRKNEDHVSNESDFTQQKQIKTVEYTNCLYTISLFQRLSHNYTGGCKNGFTQDTQVSFT